ncbi:Putative diflavin flavoprotein A 3 [Planctomycetes bacterium Pan216]|uniref:Diflavin flavoprotein A 3 n=1 Tax=Kolteria novifilia TaxID=2527975 RepID=A0A518AZD7_9BACT|nr:Putative diflavin flavoprotein A 3 [Planctomycetes bacterium Pan216]
MDLASALGRIPSGLFILTARRGEETTGMLASWVMQASFEPPCVTVVLGKDRPVTQWFHEGNVQATINILPEDCREMLSHFGKGFAPDEDAFAGVEVLPVDSDAPVLAKALAYLTGTVREGSIDCGDHEVFSIALDGGATLGDTKPYVHLRKNGLSY